MSPGSEHRRREAAERSKCQDRGSFKQNFSLESPRSRSKEKQDLVHWVRVLQSVFRLLAADNRPAPSAQPLVHGKSKKMEICLERERRGMRENPNLQ